MYTVKNLEVLTKTAVNRRIAKPRLEFQATAVAAIPTHAE
jgi:hypothetical protein